MAATSCGLSEWLGEEKEKEGAEDEDEDGDEDGDEDEDICRERDSMSIRR